MFIEDVVELVNKFTHTGITDFKVEFRDGYLWVYTKDNIIIKSRTGNRVGPDMLLGEKYVTELALGTSEILADGEVYHRQYSYDAKKEDIRAIVREEIDKFVGENYRNRLSLVEATVREEIDKYLEAKFDGRVILK